MRARSGVELVEQQFPFGPSAVGYHVRTTDDAPWVRGPECVARARGGISVGGHQRICDHLAVDSSRPGKRKFWSHGSHLNESTHGDLPTKPANVVQLYRLSRADIPPRVGDPDGIRMARPHRDPLDRLDGLWLGLQGGFRLMYWRWGGVSPEGGWRRRRGGWNASLFGGHCVGSLQGLEGL